MTVYVKWYGNMLEGEMLENEHLGMKQVRIPLDGHHPIALFTPDHVYNTPEQVTEESSIKHTNSEELCAKTQEKYTESPEIAQKQPEITQDIAINDVLPVNDSNVIEAFKQANWDHERNHLRIDKLDEFYQLWRKVMAPSGFAEAVTLYPDYPAHPFVPQWNDWNNGIKPKPIAPIIEKAIKEAKPFRQKPSKKMLRSTGQQEFDNATQLALFD